MNQSLEKKEINADPFAADIFAEARAKEEKKTQPTAEPENLNHWSGQLPKVSLSVADWDNLRRGLPSDFSDELPRRLADLLTRFLNLPDKPAVEFLFPAEREINRAENFDSSENAWWLTVRIEESKAEIAFEIDDAFAVWLVDAMLGEVISGGGQIRELTPSEQAVLEFLSLNLTGEANRVLNAPLFKFRALSREIPAFLRRNLESEQPSLLVANCQTIHELLPGIVKIYLAPEALQALQPKENRLLDVATRRRDVWQNLQNRIGNVRMRVLLGDAELSFAEIAALERGDVVLLENYGLNVSGGEISGSAEILLGDGENVKIFGEFDFAADAADEPFGENAESDDNEILIRRLNSKSDWQIFIGNFEETENPATLKEFMTETEDDYTDEFEAEETEADESDEQADEHAGLALENLAVTLRVELEARRLSLAEVGNLRENQILELGIRPTDAVNLLIDNQTVGRGELVSIEDRLGVRIIKLLR